MPTDQERISEFVMKYERKTDKKDHLQIVFSYQKTPQKDKEKVTSDWLTLRPFMNMHLIKRNTIKSPNQKEILLKYILFNPHRGAKQSLLFLYSMKNTHITDFTIQTLSFNT